MALSDCSMCWMTPCECGWDYREYPVARRMALAAAVLGVTVGALSVVGVPKVHPVGLQEFRDELRKR